MIATGAGVQMGTIGHVAVDGSACGGTLRDSATH